MSHVGAHCRALIYFINSTAYFSNVLNTTLLKKVKSKVTICIERPSCGHYKYVNRCSIYVEPILCHYSFIILCMHLSMVNWETNTVCLC